MRGKGGCYGEVQSPETSKRQYYRWGMKGNVGEWGMCLGGPTVQWQGVDGWGKMIRKGSVPGLTWPMGCIWDSRDMIYKIYRPRTRSSMPIGHALKSKNIGEGGGGI